MSEKTSERKLPTSSLNIRMLSLNRPQEIRAILESNIINGQHLPIISEIEAVIKRMQDSVNNPDSFPRFLVATFSDGAVAGVMGLNRINEDLINRGIDAETTIEIINAYVDTNITRNGVGGELLTNLRHIAVTLGFKRIAVISGPRFKEKGHEFWTKHFGKPIDTLKSYYGDGNDAKLWLYQLPEANFYKPDISPSLGNTALKH